MQQHFCVKMTIPFMMQMTMVIVTITMFGAHFCKVFKVMEVLALLVKSKLHFTYVAPKSRKMFLMRRDFLAF